MYIYMRRIRRYLGRKQWSSMLTAACWSRGFRRPPQTGFTKGMSVSRQDRPHIETAQARIRRTPI